MALVEYQPAIPLTMFPKWVTGRFYGNSLAITLTTAAGGTTVFAEQIYVPQDIVIVSIGCEVSSAGGAGSLQRAALYVHDARRGVPDQLAIDSGQIVSDATGFQSATVNEFVRQGWYWIMHANKSVTSNPTYRANHNSAYGPKWMADAWTTDLANDPRVFETPSKGTLVVDNGFPNRFFSSVEFGGYVSTFANTVSPRTLVGV